MRKHVQVREYVRGLIEDAPPGTPAPSERDLARRFGVSRTTVRQALDALATEGWLDRMPGRGTFLARATTHVQVGLAGFTEEMARRGMTASSKTLLARMESAGPGVARALEIGRRDNVVHLQRIRFADGTPMCIENAYMPDNLVPGLLDQPLPDSVFVELKRRDLLPNWGEDSVDADLARPGEAALLGIDPGSPVLRIARRVFAGNTAVKVSRATHRADRYTLWVPACRPGHSVPPPLTAGDAVAVVNAQRQRWEVVPSSVVHIRRPSALVSTSTRVRASVKSDTLLTSLIRADADPAALIGPRSCLSVR